MEQPLSANTRTRWRLRRRAKAKHHIVPTGPTIENGHRLRQLVESPSMTREQKEAIMANALSDTERALMDAYWRAANYLSVGQIYLYDNPLLKRSLTKDDIKPRLLGHWGTTPGLNFIYVHLNRVIK